MGLLEIFLQIILGSIEADKDYFKPVGASKLFIKIL